MDIHNVILTINPRLLGIGSILLNVRIMNINVLKFIIYDVLKILNLIKSIIFLYKFMNVLYSLKHILNPYRVKQ